MAANPLNKCCDLVLESSRLSKIVADVSGGLSDLGVIYLTEETAPATLRLLGRAGLEFDELFSAPAHAWVNQPHPLAGKEVVILKDLELYPCFSFDQYSQVVGRKEVGDKPLSWGIEGVEMRGSAVNPFDLLRDIEEIDGYVIWCNLQPDTMRAERLVAIPIADAVPMAIGCIKPKGTVLGDISVEVIDELKKAV